MVKKVLTSVKDFFILVFPTKESDMKGYDNARSEQNDAERFFIYESNKVNPDDDVVSMSVAQRIASNIKAVVSDHDAHLEQYFVY